MVIWKHGPFNYVCIHPTYVVHEVRMLKYASSPASPQYAYRVSIYLGILLSFMFIFMNYLLYSLSLYIYMLCINSNSILPRYTPLNIYILPPYVVY